MNLVSGLYYVLGLKLKALRKAGKISQEDLEDVIAHPTLSAIENGRAGSRNPYYLNARLVDFFTTDFQLEIGRAPITSNALIWGDADEREALIMLWTLTVLVNDTHNPFFGGNSQAWEAQPRPLGIMYLTDRTTTPQDYTPYVDYFCATERHEAYKRMAESYDAQAHDISNILWRGIARDVALERAYFEALEREYIDDDCNDANKICNDTRQLISNYLLDNGDMRVSHILTDDILLSRFWMAYCKLWERLRDDYMAYFTARLFNVFGSTELDKFGMKHINNAYIVGLYTSSELLDITKRVLLVDEYTDHGAIIASLDMRLSLVKALLGAERNAYLAQGQTAQPMTNIDAQMLTDLYHTIDYCQSKLAGMTATPPVMAVPTGTAQDETDEDTPE